MSNPGCIKTSKNGHVAHVIIHNPDRRNAVGYKMWDELADTMNALTEDESNRVTVVSGAGDKAFSAGADISEFEEWRSTPEKAKIYDQAAHRGCHALEHFPKPTIGKIRGFCVGGGFELALLCDIRVCADDARFAVTPARLGLGYDLDDTRILVGRLGASATREILFTGRMYGADEALRLGIVNKVVPGAKLDDTVEEYAQTIANNAPLTVQASKAIVAEAAKVPAEQDAKLCQRWVDRCYASEDFVEGRTAFVEKRRPAFKGR